MTDKQRIDQLEQDVGALARMLVNHQGAKPVLVEMIQRYSAGRQETRPHHAPEQRAKAVA